LFTFNVPQIGVFGAYILVFSLGKSLIVSNSLPELIPLTPVYNVALLLPSASRKNSLFALERIIIGPFRRANFSGLHAQMLTLA
jgi:hypothetical protein